MPLESPSNIRVFVRWHDQTVFAGEEARCTITFKNVAANSNQTRQQRNQQQQPKRPQNERQWLPNPFQARARGNASLTSPPSTTTTRGHRRSALSLSASATPPHSRSGSVQWPQTTGSVGDRRPGHAHKRSLSIVSIGSPSTVGEHSQRREPLSRSHRPHEAHSRAASLQLPLRQATSPGSGPHSAPFPTAHAGSPLFNASYPPSRFGRYPESSTAPNTPRPKSPRRSPKFSSRQQMPDFRFPAKPLPLSEKEAEDETEFSPTDGLLSPGNAVASDRKQLGVHSKEPSPGAAERPAARVLASNTLPGGTPRSSGEFYSMSNNSTETLISEYPNQPLARGNGRPPHLRRSSGMTSLQPRAPESLMMGYAQMQGSFILDGSLVNLAPFEQVKKQGAVGGRGGGVIGLESTKRETGLLRGLGWGSITTSLGDLLGGGELSTIKEMRGAASSKSTPLLSTPQSILFVDLQLAPGESQSYEYAFCLPKGLPPTHKGKTIKISYSLVIGTQRAGGVKEQQVRTVEIPFRVLGSVNSQGEILGHDLMNPYILLRDIAEVRSLGKQSKAHKTTGSFDAPATMNDFLQYVDDLEARTRDSAGAALLSPTESLSGRRPLIMNDGISAREAIHLAIMRSNVAGDGQQAANRFDISRNGQRVGVVMLTRPAYRLGEVVTMAIDFSEADIPCYAVHVTLETSEKVDASLAVRSESSLQRVTRKIYVASSESAMYSRRVVFTPTIPISGTPEFITSGITFEWKIRLEFVVSYQGSEALQEDKLQGSHPLLEQISQDEKGGLVLVGMEHLACESFDVQVPLRVYGAVGNGLERLERDEASEEGLVV